MHKTLTTLLALSLCLAAGCGGGDDDANEPAKAPAKTEKAAPASSTGVPSYEDVKALALKDPKVARICAKGAEDTKIGVSDGGEQYVRLICDGNRQVLDYVVGAKGVAENFDAAVKNHVFDLWKLGDEAYVSSDSFGGAKGLAAAIKAECGCGQTVKGGYGR